MHYRKFARKAIAASVAGWCFTESWGRRRLTNTTCGQNYASAEASALNVIWNANGSFDGKVLPDGTSSRPSLDRYTGDDVQ